MDAMWHLIQFTPDMRRKEPRNVGVVVSVNGLWSVKLFAVDDAGNIDGRALKKYNLTKEGYSAWVDYYRDVLSQGRWEWVLRRQDRHPAEFRLVTGGYMREVGDVEDVATRLFAELVHQKEEPQERRATALLHKVERVLSVAEIMPEQDVRVAAAWGEDIAEDDVIFDYSYTNGQVHLMDRLQLHRPSRDSAKAVAREFNARVTAARAAGASDSFIAFYSSEAVEDMGGDSMLTPVFKVAKIVDVDNEEAGATALRGIMYG